MNQRYWRFYAVPFFLISACLAGIPSALATESLQKNPQVETRGKSEQHSQPTVMSRKCAIYSGICLMGIPAAVGAYCVCHTPAGINYGVVIP